MRRAEAPRAYYNPQRTGVSLYTVRKNADIPTRDAVAYFAITEVYGKFLSAPQTLVPRDRVLKYKPGLAADRSRMAFTRRMHHTATASIAATRGAMGICSSWPGLPAVGQLHAAKCPDDKLGEKLRHAGLLAYYAVRVLGELGFCPALAIAPTCGADSFA